MEAVLVDFGAAYPASGSGSALFVAQATTIQMVHNSTLVPIVFILSVYRQYHSRKERRSCGRFYWSGKTLPKKS